MSIRIVPNSLHEQIMAKIDKDAEDQGFVNGFIPDFKIEKVEPS